MNLIAHFYREHLTSITIGLVSVLLVVYGNTINKFFRKLTRGMNFWLRYGLFILLCTVGYGFLGSQLVKFLRSFFASTNDVTVVGGITGAFLLLAYIARAGKEV